MEKLHYKPAAAAKIVKTCCVLDNIANKANCELPPLNRHEEQEQQQEQRLAAEFDARQQNAVIYLAMAPDRCWLNKELQLGRAARQALVRQLANYECGAPCYY
ncbi:uncharacterized protein LOC125242106 [Leguminivora glycinivorella]|uniref:uncharacterized protein LOC125228265 n=1 Tax=Leguminivora glycinivorella TaxID=1035111 RepID=UPI00200DD0C2|nr:uncharacterized protein LOC125228265 [Leguminivora glycinivorella]XP_047991997.1 uncharacterized protein LOC125230812 [Leguminivora glycinivorella]XP_047997195.1 uncharacterized protein LOC125234829 [Leguminivora glycinivorella]XP_048006774.1 uncharacterized protein LOC125242106 [Leguminivora glycinivorella]